MSEFDTIYVTYRPRILAMAWRLTCGVGGDARREEIAAAGMVALWQAHASYKPGRGVTFWQYAGKIVHGTMVDEMRVSGYLSRKAYETARGGKDSVASIPSSWQAAMLFARSLEAARDVPSSDDPEEDLQHKENVALVSRAVEALRGSKRRVIHEYYFEDRNLLDVGRELGVSESRVCQIKKSALKTMEVVLACDFKKSTDLQKPRGARKPRFLTVNGVTKRLHVWAHEKGVYPSLIVNRMRHGWSPEKAVNEPVVKRMSHGTSIRLPKTEGHRPESHRPENLFPEELSPLVKRASNLCDEILLHRVLIKHESETKILRADLTRLLQEIHSKI